MGGTGGSTLNRLPDVASRMPSYSPTRDRDPSPSIETSRSTTSLHPGDASYLPPEADHVNGNRRPILHAKLVRGPSGYGVGGSFVPGPRKSRSITRGRLGRFGEDGDGAPGSDGLANGANGIIERQHTQGSVEGTNACDLPPDLSIGAIKSPSTEASPVATDFKIEDVGKIACSWGD
ncbi:hypothetical protein PHLCEN_2v146 [Hermanssonia centrifuga]|uniref:Uncharacterized protein n=1 Tax=Hermanssonia centrifuga TaxID=98765 RepID=A0A2R6S6W1_9APHY|nr:hypothetical protein PHLCEN_2v146 [Hermanssonia centrifuga]